MSNSYIWAWGELTKRDASGNLIQHSITELYEILDQVTGSVSQSVPGDTYFLYSGKLSSGASAGSIVGQVLDSGQSGLFDIADSEVGKLLDSPLFIKAVEEAVAREEFLIELNNASVDIKNQILNRAKIIISGTNDLGEHINSASMWDIASEKYVSAANGNFRLVIPGELSNTSVFIQSELPSLLTNPNISTIEGLSRTDLQKIVAEGGGIERLKQILTAQSFMNLAASGAYSNLNATNIDNFLNITSQDIAKNGLNAEQMTALTDALKTVDANTKSYLGSAAEALKSFASSGVVSGLSSSTLKHLPVLGVLVTFSIASAEANTAAAAGNYDEARHRMGRWALETMVSEAASVAAGALAVMAAAAVGVTSGAVLAVIGIGAAIVGGILGEEEAKNFYQAFIEMSPELQEDIIDRLNVLYYGEFSNQSIDLKVGFQQGQLSFKDINFIDATRDQIIASAKENIAWRYALRELNPFVISGANYDQHNTDGSLDLYDPETNTGLITDKWLQARAGFLRVYRQSMNAGDTDGFYNATILPYDLFGVGLPVVLGGDYHFVDYVNNEPYEITVDGTDFGILPANQVLFGGDKSEILTGKKADDLIFGGKGNDFIVGGEGDDYLEGGEGNDSYHFANKYGEDKVFDTDGKGSVVINGDVMGHFEQKKGSSVYENEDGYELRAINEDGGISLVINRAGNKDNTVTIKHWSEEKNLGIDLEEVLPDPPPPPEPYVPTSPLILDLDGDGVETVGLDHKIYFDHNDDGFRELTGFVGVDDGLLVVDKNNDGKITSGNELFGNNTRLLNGTYASNGFIALKEYDTNGDNRVDQNDSGFSQLKIWRDLNQNGKTDADELSGLADIGVASISVTYASKKIVDNDDNQHLQQGTYITQDGKTLAVNDVWFKRDLSLTKTDKVEVSSSIEVLPDVKGYGKTYSLHQAMSRDSSGNLQNLVNQFISANSFEEKKALVEQIIFSWTGQTGAYRPYYQSEVDARRIGALETYYGYKFGTPRGTGQQYTIVFNEHFQSFFDVVFYQLSTQSFLSTLFSEINWNYRTADKLLVGDFTAIPQALVDAFNENPTNAKMLMQSLYHAVNGVNPYDEKHTNTELLLASIRNNMNASIAYEFMSAIDLTDSPDIDEILVGTSGHDVLNGYDGNDSFIGNAGDDYLSGGNGNDGYSFNRGDGLDLIVNSDGNYGKDIILLGNNIHSQDIKIQRIGRDINLVVTPGVDEVRIQDFFFSTGELDNTAAIDEIHFASGEVWDVSKIKAESLKGSFNSESLTGFYDNDVLIGGKGNDNLSGLYGNDTYYFVLGDGHDSINDVAGIDTIKFGEGVSDSIVSIKKVGTSLVVYYGVENSVTVSSMFEVNGAIKQNEGIEKIEFSTGVMWDIDYIRYKTLHGGGNNETINAFDSDDVISGNGGDDTLYGMEGNDIYNYNLGDGNDIIIDSKGVDAIKFGIGITPSDIRLQIDRGFHLQVLLSGGSTITIKNALDGNGNFIQSAIETIYFANGQSWDQNKFKTEIQNNLNSIFIGTDVNDVIIATEGNNTIVGSKGDDTLRGYAGNDTYIYNLGDGNDTIIDESGIEKIQFGAGILPEDIQLEQNEHTLYVRLSSGNFITFDMSYSDVLDAIIFSDGAVWNQDKIRQLSLIGTSQNDVRFGSYGSDTLTGFAGEDELHGEFGDDVLFGGDDFDRLYGGRENDILVGGRGYDLLEGGVGNDKYFWNLSDGIDQVFDENGIDELVFGRNISPEDVVVQVSGPDIFIGVDRHNGVYINQMWLTGNITQPYSIESVRFANGVVWTSSDIGSMLITPTTTSGDLLGTGGDDVLSAKGAVVSLHGRQGNDSYVAKPGEFVHMEINDSYGSNKLIFEGGVQLSDITVQTSGNGLLIGLKTGESIGMPGYFVDGEFFGGISSIQFSDGIQISVNELLPIASELNEDNNITADVVENIIDGTNLNDSIFGTAKGDLIIGGNGDDVLSGGTGSDTLKGDAGNDVLYGSYGQDKLYGGAGDDRLYGGFGQDSLFGEDGNDYLSSGFISRQEGGTGDDTLVSTSDAFNVDMFGGAGNDLYIINGYGVSVADTLGIDRVKLSESTTPENIEIVVEQQQEGNLAAFSIYNAEIKVAEILTSMYAWEFSFSQYLQSSNVIEYLEFSNGTVWDKNQIIQAAIRPTANIDSTGKLISGKAEVGSNIVVKDAAGNQLAVTTTDESGTFNIILDSTVDEAIYLTATNINGNTSFIRKVVTPDFIAPIQPTATLSEDGKVISGIAEAGTIVTVKDSIGVQYGSTIANASGSYNAVLNKALVNGEVVSVSSIDMSGNISAVSDIYAPDITAPTIPSAYFNAGGKSISGTAERGISVIVQDAFGVQIGIAKTDYIHGSFTVVLDNPLINKETINVIAKDMMGYTSSARTLVAPDLTPPSPPVAIFDSTGKIISGTAEKGSTVVVKNASGMQIGTATANATTGVYSITLSIALINKQVVSMTAKDTVGNISDVINIIAPDKTAPVVPTALFDASGQVITGVAEMGSTVIVKNSSGTQIGTGTADATTGNYTVTLSTALINKETVNVTAADDVGNISTAKAIVAPDLTPPSKPTATFNSAGKIISGTAEKSSTVIITNADGIQIGSATANSSSGSYSITLTTALINKEVVNVVAKDAAGNSSPIANPIAPDLTKPVSPSAVFDTTGKIITGVAETGSTVIVKNSSGTQIGTATADAATGDYTVTLATALINKQTVNVTAKDLAGNISAVKAIIAPDLTAPSKPTASINTTGTTITGSAEKGSSVIVKTAEGVELGSAIATTTSTTSTTGTFTITLSSAQINKEILSVTAVDIVGNISPVLSVTAPDKTPPAAPTAVIDSTGKIITGIAEVGSTVAVKNSSGTQLSSVTANATTGAYTITLSTAITVGQTVNVTAKDAAGNVSGNTPLTRPAAVARIPDSDVRVEQLIQAMASFAPPSGIETNVLSGFDDRSNHVIAVGQ